MKRTVLFVVAVLVFAGCATAPTGTEAVPDGAAGRVTETFDPGPSAARYFVDAVNSWDNTEQALRLLSEAIEIDPAFALAYFERANRYRKLGRRDAALDDYRAAIEADPGFLQAYRARYELRVNELGDQSGIQDLERAYAIDPDHLDTALTYAGYLSWKQPEDALAIYDRLVAIYPQESGPLVNRAKFYRDRSDFDRALADFRSAVTAGDRSPWLEAEVVWMQLATGDRQGAGAAAARVLEREPASPEASLVAARTSALAGAATPARRLYADYLAYQWADPAVWLEVAMLAAAGGDAAAASDSLDQFRARKEDRERVQIAQLATMVLLGQRERAIGALETLTADKRQDLRPWLVYALVARGDEAQRIRVQTREIVSQSEGGVTATLVRFPELWVFSRLYLDREGLRSPEGIPIP